MKIEPVLLRERFKGTLSGKHKNTSAVMKLAALGDFIIIAGTGAGYGDSNNYMYTLEHQETKLNVCVEVDIYPNSISVHFPFDLIAIVGTKYNEVAAMRSIASRVNRHAAELLKSLNVISDHNTKPTQEETKILKELGLIK